MSDLLDFDDDLSEKELERNGIEKELLEEAISNAILRSSQTCIRYPQSRDITWLRRHIRLPAAVEKNKP